MLTLFLLVASALAQAPPDEDDPGWWVGLPLSGVQFSAPEGGLPEETLEPLLRARQGDRLDAWKVRLDLATLFRVGEFSAVQADVQPWVVYDDRGEPTAGALLTYVVYPAPTLARVQITGNKAFRNRKVLDAAGLSTGQVFYLDLDGPRTEDRVGAWLRRQGYPDATVQLRTTEPEPGRLYAVIVVDEGEPDIVQALNFTGELDGVVRKRQLRRWAKRGGLEEGEPRPVGAITGAQEVIREELGNMQPGLFRRRRGWISARVTPAVINFDSGARVTYHIEPGPRLELDVDGLVGFPRRKVREGLGIDHRLRLTRGFLDEAPDEMEAWLQQRGWLEAQVDVSLAEPEDGKQVLAVDIDRGAHFTMGPSPDIRYVDMEFSFARELDRRQARQESRALQAVFDQASPEVIRRDYYTEPEMREGLSAAREMYRNRGHLDAELQLLEPETRPRTTPGSLFKRAFGQPPGMLIRPRVAVDAGPVTRQTGLEVVGAAPDVDLSFVDAVREERVGAPFSPQRIEQLARRVIEVHQQAGFLEADTRVRHDDVGDQQRASTIEVSPGPRILLRSTVIRGARLTRTPFLRRQVDLELGQPVRSDELEDLRSQLYNLGIFRTVELDLLGDEAARDLVIGVDERARWAFEAGGGLNTDQGVRLFGRATRRNLWGLAHRLQLLGQIGLDYRSEDLRDWLVDINNPEWRAAISYTAPRFPVRASELVLDIVLRERRQERTWRMDRTGGGFAVQVERRREARGTPGRFTVTRLRGGMRLETRQLNEIDPGALIQGEPWLAILEDPDRSWRVQEAVTALLLHDRRDDPLQPRSGVLLSLNGEWAPGLPWDELRQQPRTAFLKGEARLSGYAPMGGLVLHLAARGGHATAYGDGPVPLEDRFRLGGTGSLRGYIRDAVGPQNIAPPVVVDWPSGIGPVIDYAARNNADRWVPTGGDTSFMSTTELIMPLPALGLVDWEGYAATLFADVGNVWLIDPDVTTTSQQTPWRDVVPFLRVGVGAGLRIATPIGPLQLDGAVNPQVLRAEDRQEILLEQGWEEPWFRLHLTLGATF